MRVRNNPDAKILLKENSKYIESVDKLQEILAKNTKVVHVEIGMGKGQFISQMAKIYPDVLFIGIELSETVLSLAIKKITIFEEENNIILNNLYVMSFNAKDITEVFKKSQVDKIYLNFSDPWPKKRHQKRRLTNEEYLKLYRYILKPSANIQIKTDNRKFFEYTILSVTNNSDFKIDEIHLDLHKDDILNVMSEYEEKFCAKGPIYMMIIS